MPVCVQRKNLLHYLQNGEQFFVTRSTCFGVEERQVQLVFQSNNEIWYTFPDSWFKGWYRPTRTSLDNFIYIDDNAVYIL